MDDIEKFRQLLQDPDQAAAFTKEQAEGLVGMAVTKRALDPDNPSVSIGQLGVIVSADRCDPALADGYSVTVNWGTSAEPDRWEYSDWLSFAEDVSYRKNEE